MNTKLKNLLTLALAAGLLYGFLLWGVLRPDAAMSTTERRPLTQRPQLTVQTMLSGQFADRFERYTRSKLVSRSEKTNPSSMVQLPSCRRAMCRFLIALRR